MRRPEVFDGDGFLTRIVIPGRNTAFEATVRLGLIDAPEMQQRRGREACEFLTQLIGGNSLELRSSVRWALVKSWTVTRRFENSSLSRQTVAP